MNAKQRVHAALRRQPVDRVPVFMWFHPETTRQPGRAAGDPGRRTWPRRWATMCARPGSTTTTPWKASSTSTTARGTWTTGASSGSRQGLQPDRAFPAGRRGARGGAALSFPGRAPARRCSQLMAPVLARRGRVFHRLRRLALRVRDVLAAARHGGGHARTWRPIRTWLDEMFRPLRRFLRAAVRGGLRADSPGLAVDRRRRGRPAAA